MVIKLSKRLTSAILFLALAVFLLLGVPDSGSLSYFMPELYGWLLILSAALLAVQYFAGRGKDPNDTLTLDFRDYLKSSSFRIFAFLLMITAYYILVSFTGFVVTTALFLVASYWFLGVRSPRVYLVSLAIMGVLYVVFAFPLGVHFPHGFLY